MLSKWLGALLACVVVMSGAAQKKPPPRSKTAARVKAAPISPDVAQANRWMRPMTLREKVAQLVVGTTYGEAPGARSADFRKYQRWVRDLRIGGLIAVNRVVAGNVRNAEPFAMAAFFNRMQRIAKVPLLISADFERGASMRVANSPKFPYNMAYGAARDLEATKFEGAETAREARALGVQWVFAPVADVNNNPLNPVINIRSYGENPEDVSAQVKAYIEGAHSDPKARVLLTGKHFPGHGDTATNSHLEMARLEASRERMDALELKPFRAAIQAGVDAVMTAHMAVPAIEDEDVPATLSPKILTGLLRKELAFPGLIVTDALDMKGVSEKISNGEACVRALEAGADILLMPPKPEVCIDAVLAAVRKKRLTVARIEDSTRKLLAAKAHVGLHKQKLVDVEAVSDILDSPDAYDQAQSVADKAMTLVRDDRNLVPLADGRTACAFAITERRNSPYGAQFLLELRRRVPGIKASAIDGQWLDTELQAASDAAAGCSAIVVATYVTASDSRNDVALPPNLMAFVNRLIEGSADGKAPPVILVSLGSPYLLQAFPKVAAYLASFSTTTTSETAAAKALAGEIAIGGKLPVTIPGFAKYGDGISREARAAATNSNVQR
ncbi:MAG: glycoside hydrolase family 3 N-terminal domain-containing protein [Bryobacteraceae bacterium]